MFKKKDSNERWLDVVKADMGENNHTQKNAESLSRKADSGNEQKTIRRKR